MDDWYLIARQTLLRALELARSGQPDALQTALNDADRVLYGIASNYLEERGIPPERNFYQTVYRFLCQFLHDEDLRQRYMRGVSTYRTLRNRTKELATPPQDLVKSCINTVWIILQFVDPVSCPICEKIVLVPLEQRIVSCVHCNEDLEVVSVDPLQLKPLHDYVDEQEWEEYEQEWEEELEEDVEEYNDAENVEEEYEKWQEWWERFEKKRRKPRFVYCPTCGKPSKIN